MRKHWRCPTTEGTEDTEKRQMHKKRPLSTSVPSVVGMSFLPLVTHEH
jgi:hypothetical protein